MSYLDLLLMVIVAATVATDWHLHRRIVRLERTIRNQAVWIEAANANAERTLTHTLRVDGRLNRQEIYRRNQDPLNYPVTNEDDMVTDIRHQLKQGAR